jgi:hypothetical protein
MQTIKKRQTIERKVVRHLIRTAKKHGWDAFAVDDGEERVKCRTEKDVMDAVFAVDEATIRFKYELAYVHSAVHCAVIVLGNDGYDAIADCSIGKGWDDVMQESSRYCDTLAMEAS